MALKIDKEAFLEFIIQKKDPLFVLLLVIVLAGGGWYLYQSTSQSVDEIIGEVLQKPQGPTGTTEENQVSSENVVDELTDKPAFSLYTPQRNPFGSQEEEEQLREKVTTAYNSAVDLYKAGQYEQAIRQFDRVITLDVTESRITYPVLPSEYKRRALRESAKENLDKILSEAQQTIQQGDQLRSQNQNQQALEAYNKANEKLSAVINSDPTGESIGQANLDKVKTLQQEAYNKSLELQRQTLLADLQSQLSAAQSAITSQNFYNMLVSLKNLNILKSRIQEIDPTGDIIKQTDRDRLTSIIQDIQDKLKDSYAIVIQQTEQKFTEAINNQDQEAAQEAVNVLAIASNFYPEQKQDIQGKIRDFVNRRGELVVQLAQQFYDNQNSLLQQGNYDQFDQAGKQKWLRELTNLRRSGGQELSSSLSNQINNIETKLSSLRMPPKLTEAYQFTSVEYTPTKKVKVNYIERGARSTTRPKTLYLSKGETDNRTKITIKQVDTTDGFVILSKSGYMDTQLSLNTNN